MTAQDAGQLIAERFRLERRMRDGPRSSLWAARDERSGASVALKLVAGTEAQASAAAFARQAEATARIASRQLVQVVDHGLAPEAAYLAMELLEGEDVGSRIGRDGRVSLATATLVSQEVAEVLARAREARLVHDHLAAEHVFLAKDGGGERVVVLSFAASTRREGGGEGGPRGDAAYLSPEQLRGQPVDTRSDLWSLGVVLFHAITGRPPFEAATLPDLVMKICADPLPKASRTAPGVPPALDVFFQRALAREPIGRFQSPPELAAAFESACSGQAPAVVPVVAFVPVTIRSRERSGSSGRTATWMSITIVLAIVILFLMFGVEKTMKRINDLFKDIGWRTEEPLRPGRDVVR